MDLKDFKDIKALEDIKVFKEFKDIKAFKENKENKDFKDKTFFLADQEPAAWEARQEAFEGEGGLHHPTGVRQEQLSNGDALYETPAAILQYRVSLAAGERREKHHDRSTPGPGLEHHAR